MRPARGWLNRKVNTVAAAALLAVCSSISLASNCPALAETLHRTLEFQGLTRNYLVYLPTGYTGKVSLPTIIMLHPAGGTARRALKISGIKEKAHREHFIVLSSNDTGLLKNFLLTWNS